MFYSIHLSGLFLNVYCGVLGCYSSAVQAITYKLSNVRTDHQQSFLKDIHTVIKRSVISFQIVYQVWTSLQMMYNIIIVWDIIPYMWQKVTVIKIKKTLIFLSFILKNVVKPHYLYQKFVNKFFCNSSCF